MKRSTHFLKFLCFAIVGCLAASTSLLVACTIIDGSQFQTPTTASSGPENIPEVMDQGIEEQGRDSPEDQSSLATELSATARGYLHAGWLHFIQENSSDTDRGNNGTLENGAVLSANHFWECWLNLDEALQIHESICIQTNPYGSIIQVGARSGSVSWNSATDEILTVDDPSPAYISDIDALMRRVAKIGVELETETVLAEGGQTLLQLSYESVEESPIPLDAYDLPVIRWDYIHQFDPETGMLVNYQEWVAFEDGNQRIIQETVMQVFEIVEMAPEDILDYLSGLEN